MMSRQGIMGQCRMLETNSYPFVRLVLSAVLGQVFIISVSPMTKVKLELQHLIISRIYMKYYRSIKYIFFIQSMQKIQCKNHIIARL